MARQQMAQKYACEGDPSLAHDNGLALAILHCDYTLHKRECPKGEQKGSQWRGTDGDMRTSEQTAQVAAVEHWRQ
jgi:hypothetical protein